MTDNELLQAANDGNIQAIIEYAGLNLLQSKYDEAKAWYHKGALAGNSVCMLQYANLTIINVQAHIRILPSDVATCLNDLQDALMWVKVAKDLGTLDNATVQTSLSNIYDRLTWCSYLAYIKTKAPSCCEEIIANYGRITATPHSESSYAYFIAMRDMGDRTIAFNTAFKVVSIHDDTLKDFMLGVLYAHLSKEYFEGVVVEPCYDSAYECAKQAQKYDPECRMTDFFESGHARSVFNRKHYL